MNRYIMRFVYLTFFIVVKGASYGHPYYWASFILIDNWL